MWHLRRFNSGLVKAGLSIAIALLPGWHAEAKYMGANQPCMACLAGTGPQKQDNLRHIYRSDGNGTAISLIESNLRTQYPTNVPTQDEGPALRPELTYNSYDADGSRARINTVLGYGWTHRLNLYLFRQINHIFRVDGEGGITRFRIGPGGQYLPMSGYFESLVLNPDGTYTLRQDDGDVYRYALIPGTPFMVGGPVYRITSLTDRNDNVTTFTYSSGNLTQVMDTYGRITVFTYNALNRINTVTDPMGRITRYEYNPSGVLLTRITDPNNRITRYEYNSTFQMTRKIDPDGRIFTFQYSSGKPIAILDALGKIILKLTNTASWGRNNTALATSQTLEFTPATTSHTDGRGNIWRYTYEKHGYITKIVAPDGATITYQYDPATLMPSASTNANGHTTLYQYDSRANLIRITDPLLNVTTYTYEPVFNQVSSMTDPNGRVTTYEYDARGNRIKETDPLLNTRMWTYDSHGDVTIQQDRNGNVTMYHYDSNGHRDQMTDPLGELTNYHYDALGNLLSLTDPHGHTTTYQYDNLNRRIQVTDALGGVTTHTYDGAGHMLTDTNPNGQTIMYQYDHRGRQTRITDAMGHVSMTTYDGNNNAITRTDPNVHVTTYVYDVQNRPTMLTDAAGHITRYQYDSVGNMTKETNANGHATAYAYDALNRRIVRQAADGGITTYQYDAVGSPGCCSGTQGSNLLTKKTDGNGKVTYYKYDDRNRLVIENRKEGDTADLIDASDAVTTYTYDANDNNLARREPNGLITRYQYDALDRKIQTTNPAGEIAQSEYDNGGNLIRILPPNGNTMQYTYDALHRVTKTTDTLGTHTTYTYDPIGNKFTEANGKGETIQYQYDADNRLVRQIDPLGGTRQFAYDAVGNRTQETDANGKITAYMYDPVDRRTQQTDPLGNITRFQYDGVDNLTRITDALGQVTRYTYDPVDRRVSEIYADGGVRTYAYDFEGNLLRRTDQLGQITQYTYNDLYFLTDRTYPAPPHDQFTYDLSGRMLTALRGSWLAEMIYDGANRIIKAVENGTTITTAYNIAGRARQLTYPNGRMITENLTARDLIDRIDDSASTGPLVHYMYDAADRPIRRDYLNATTGTYQYDANGRVTDVRHEHGGTRIAEMHYAYDPAGNKLIEDKLHQPIHGEAYQYDDSDRLIEYRQGTIAGTTVGLPLTRIQYDLDPLSNWRTKTTNGVPEARTHTPANAISMIDATPIISNVNGNVTEDPLFRYSYDFENRLTQVIRKIDLAVVGDYQYDALGRQVIAVRNPAGTPFETRYFHDGWRAIEEQDDAGVTQATYVYGNYIDETLAMDRAAARYYYHQNALYSPTALTDATGKAVEGYEYDPYGRQTVIGPGLNTTLEFGGDDVFVPGGVSGVGNPLLYTGQRLDLESGLYHYRMRMLHPEHGRFITRDPLGYIEGLNLYEYVKSRPTGDTDPFGLWTDTKTFEGVLYEDPYWRARGKKWGKAMEYKVEINYGCIGPQERQAWHDVAKVVDSNLQDNLDSKGFSVLIVGVTESDWVEAQPSAVAAECPAGMRGTRMTVTVHIKHMNKFSGGINPGIGPFSWDLGISFGKDPRVVASTYPSFEIYCCCKVENAAK